MPIPLSYPCSDDLSVEEHLTAAKDLLALLSSWGWVWYGWCAQIGSSEIPAEAFMGVSRLITEVHRHLDLTVEALHTPREER